MDNRARAIMSFVGILKAGCAYVPMDPSDALPRIESILTRCAPRVLLVTGSDTDEMVETLRARGALRGTSVGRLDTVGPSPTDLFDFEPAHYDVRPEDTAYILFTSGSTGEPKGVPITHDNVRRFIEWVVEYFQLGPDDRLSGHSNVTFDMSTLDIWASFAAGAELHPVPASAQMLPRQIVAFMRERDLTFWFSVPSVLAFVARFDGLPDDALPALRHVVWGGDVFPPPSLAYWRRKLPRAAFTNVYGPTEATVASTYYRLPADFDDTRDVPIGRALPGEEILLLDTEGAPVPEGEMGEIHIKGVGVSQGYWKDPERTRASFVPDPTSSDPEARIYRTGDLGRLDAEGNLHFLGRSDFQIKSAGYRVEPGEVESALLQLPDIGACAVVPVPTDGFEGAVIGCAYVPSNGTPVPPRAVKAQLSGLLPRYMIPSRWMPMEELPISDRGKLDRIGVRSLFLQEPRP